METPSPPKYGLAGDGYIVENVYEPLDAPGYHAAIRRREDWLS